MVNTSNPSFNDSWQLLTQYHKEVDSFSPAHALDLSHTPKFKSDREWQFYLQALTEFLTIGKRNNWVKTHVNGGGFPVFFLIDDDIYEGRIS